MVTPAPPYAIIALIGPNVPSDEVYLTQAGLRIGRTGSNDLVLDSRAVSREHALLSLRDGVVYITDLNSSGGTWVGDQRLTPQAAHELRIGESVRIDAYTLTLRDGVYGAVDQPDEPDPISTPEVGPAEATSEPEPERALPSSVLEAPTREADPPIPRPPTTPPPPSLPPTLLGDDLFDADGYPIGFSKEKSNWLQYLPEIYGEDDFIGRYLLIAETILVPITWMIDHFDLYLSPEITSDEWLRWIASWFDLLLTPTLPIENQRAVMKQIGWLFFRRGTRTGLQRLLELYCNLETSQVEIIEAHLCHFTVRLDFSTIQQPIERQLLERLIESQKPAFADYTLEIAVPAETQ